MLAALAGGVGAARFLRGLVQVVPPDDVTVIVNTGDDDEFHGLLVCPDLDTVTYTLAGVENPDTGGGSPARRSRRSTRSSATACRRGSASATGTSPRTSTAATACGRALPSPTVTAEIAAAWDVRSRLLPMTDDPVSTRINVPTGEGSAVGARDAGVVRPRAQPSRRSSPCGSTAPNVPPPPPACSKRWTRPTTIVVCPSNPVISIGPILAVPGVRDALRRRRDRVVGVSPIIGGAPVKGPADRLMGPLGIEVSCVGVARAYRDFCSALVIDGGDAARAPEVEAPECTPSSPTR